MIVRVVVAISEPDLRKRMERLLPADGVAVDVIPAGERLWERAAGRACEVIVTSRGTLPEPLGQALAIPHKLPERASTVVLSDSANAAEHGELTALGADAVLYAGMPDDRLGEAIAQAIARREDLAEAGASPHRTSPPPRLSDFVTDSSSMQLFMEMVRRIVRSDASLLILGETGVGKEHLARAIHGEGPRAAGPFVAVNCGALPEGLLESELFGHEEGAFTGATRSRRGCFELAHRGTLFLDEIAEMPTHLQVRLLRVLQDRQVHRLGAERAVTVDVRVMAASNRDLEAEVQHGAFRRDLYYRLGVVSLTVPALRDRREDIPALVDSYIRYLGPRIGRSVGGIASDAMAALCAHDWPGNVRELINVIERALLLCGEEEIAVDHLPDAIASSSGRDASPPAGAGEAIALPERTRGQTLADVRDPIIAAVERAYLDAALRETRGRVGQAARRAGVRERTLYEKMRRYGLRKENYR